MALSFFKKRERGQNAEMSFVDHLEELRWHIIRSVIAILVGAIAIFVFARDVVDSVILGPTHPDFVTYNILCKIGRWLHLEESLCFSPTDVKLLATAMTEQFVSTFTVAFVGGFIIAFPYIFYEFWKFVRPALSKKELKQTRGVIFWVSLLFLMGVAFGYFVLTPFMVNFYFNYKLSDIILIQPTFSDYLENLIYTTVGIGILFQMPLLIMVLARIGIITAAFMKKYRRHAVVLILIAAAIITPSTDPFSLALVTAPLYVLFEASIVLAKRVAKSRMEDDESVEEWS